MKIGPPSATFTLSFAVPTFTGLPVIPPIFDEIRNWMIPVARKHALSVESRLMAEIRRRPDKVLDTAPGGAYLGPMPLTNTLPSETLIRDCTCRACGEEFVTPDERATHDCPVSAVIRLNAYLDSLADGWAVRDVENLHRDVVLGLTETDAAVMLHSLVARSAAADARPSRVSRLDAAVADVAPGARLRRNRYQATCRSCGNTVEVGEGMISRNAADTHWITVHDNCVNPPVDTAAAPAPTSARPYRQDGEIHRVVDSAGSVTYYRVRTSRRSGRRFAQAARLMGSDLAWFYVPNALRLLSDATLLTWEQAREFGILHGNCVRCSRALTDERSVAAGYGETCAGHMGWPYPSAYEARALIADRTAR